MVLAGRVNMEIVSLMCHHGARAVGLSGKDDAFLRCERLERVKTKSRREVDPGRVGRVVEVRTDVIDQLVQGGFIPVIAPIGIDAQGRSLNVNAVAGAVAAATKAEKLLLMTDIEGVRDTSGAIASSMTAHAVKALIDEGTISGGMIPKVQSALDALSMGVAKCTSSTGASSAPRSSRSSPTRASAPRSSCEPRRGSPSTLRRRGGHARDDGRDRPRRQRRRPPRGLRRGARVAPGAAGRPGDRLFTALRDGAAAAPGRRAAGSLPERRGACDDGARAACAPRRLPRHRVGARPHATRALGPRTIDLDLLFALDADGAPIRVATERLTLPHPGLVDREFALRPLLDVAPELAGHFEGAPRS